MTVVFPNARSRIMGVSGPATCQRPGPLVGLRKHRSESGRDFPPSVAAVSALARQDPSRPTFDELLAQLYGPGGVFGFKRSNVTVSPWVLAFVDRHGRERLRMLEIDGDEGKWRRRELEQAWTAFLEVSEGREVHEIASRSARGSLGRPDFAGALSAGDTTTGEAHE